MPLEHEVLRNERQGKPGLPPEKLKELQLKAKEAGFWGINTPEEYGGANLGHLMTGHHSYGSGQNIRSVYLWRFRRQYSLLCKRRAKKAIFDSDHQR